MISFIYRTKIEIEMFVLEYLKTVFGRGLNPNKYKPQQSNATSKTVLHYSKL